MCSGFRFTSVLVGSGFWGRFWHMRSCARSSSDPLLLLHLLTYLLSSCSTVDVGASLRWGLSCAMPVSAESL